MSRSEALVRRLEAEISDDKLPAGTRLGTKEDLRKRFGVAAGTINEAVRMLEMRGVVNARPGPGGGLFVAATSPTVRLRHVTLRVKASTANLIRDALVVRNVLESAVCADAGRYRTKKDIKAMERCLKRMENAKDANSFMHDNWDLHRAIVAITPNRVLRDIYLELLEVTENALEAAHPDEEVLEQQNRDHRVLVEAIASQDQEQIAAAVKAHDPTLLLTMSQPQALT